MTTFREFMKQNVKEHEQETHVLSDRYLDEFGKPMRFVFRPLKSRDVDAARDAAMEKDKRGNITNVNTTKLMHTLITKAMVCPDLTDAELQNSWGVLGSSELISEMFDAREYGKLNDIVGALAGFNKDDKDLIDEAKN